MLKRDIETIELDGDTFELRPLGYADYFNMYDEVVQYLRFQRLKTIIDLRDALSQEMWKEEWERAKEEAYKITTASEEQVKQWCNTLDGAVRCVYRQLLPKYAGRFTVDELKQLLCEKGDLELKAKAARDATPPQEAEGSGK
jgi:hypothetical protein